MSLDIFGDRWSLLIVRDLLCKGRKTYQEFMASGEDIATNILADRLAHLEKSGIITWERDALDGRRINYGLTPKGLALAPDTRALAHIARLDLDFVVEAWTS